MPATESIKRRKFLTFAAILGLGGATAGLTDNDGDADATVVDRQRLVDDAPKRDKRLATDSQISQSLQSNGLIDSRDVDGRSKVDWVTDEGREAVREHHE